MVHKMILKGNQQGTKYNFKERFSWVQSLILKECFQGTQYDIKGDPTGYKI